MLVKGGPDHRNGLQKQLYGLLIYCTRNLVTANERKTKSMVFGSKTHYDDVIMGAMVSEITRLTLVYSTVYSVEDQRKHQSSALLTFVRGIHRGPVNSPHKWPVTRKLFPFDDVIMQMWIILWWEIDRKSWRLQILWKYHIWNHKYMWWYFCE